MSHYVDRYWDLRRSKQASVKQPLKYGPSDFELSCLDPDPRHDVPESEEDDTVSEEVNKLKLEAHCSRHRPRLSDEYGDE